MYDSFSSLIYASTASMIVKQPQRNSIYLAIYYKAITFAIALACVADHDRDGALPNYLRKVSLPNLRRRVILFRESLCKESASQGRDSVSLMPVI